MRDDARIVGVQPVFVVARGVTIGQHAFFLAGLHQHPVVSHFVFRVRIVGELELYLGSGGRFQSLLIVPELAGSAG